jgi:selenocysteine-specific elongation factor
MIDPSRPSVIVGTAGHVDHGKSSLVQALTGVNPDRLQEERDRGLTIELGFARLDVAGGPEIGIVDVPGHEDFIRNMLAGATGIDLVLLTVAADEGPMPQTHEHLAIARLLGMGRGLVALTKVDRVDDEWRDLAIRLVRDELSSSGIGVKWPIIPVSVVSGEGIDELRQAILSTAAAVDPRTREDLFRLPVDRAFTVRGAGTVVTGSVWSGTVKKGDRVRLLPSGSSARVRSVQVHGEERASSGAGARCALSLAGLSLQVAGRGETVVSDPGWRGIRRFGARLELLPDAPSGVEHAETIRLYHGTAETTARVLLGSEASMPAGASGWAVLVCADPIVARARDRFVARTVTPLRTIGGGIIADLDPPRRWRERTEAWEAILDGDDLRTADAVVQLAGGTGLDPAVLPLRTGMPPARSGVQGKYDVIGGRWFALMTRTAGRDAIREYIGRAHADSPRVSGVSLQSVRTALLPSFALELLDHELEVMELQGEIERDGPDVRLRGHEVRLTNQEADSLEQIAAEIAAADLSPPSPARLTELAGVDRSLVNDLLRLLVDEGRLIRVNPEVYLAREAEARLRSSALRVLERDSPASPAAFGHELGLSRRVLIPLLEYLDRLGMTRRTPQGRVLDADQST